ncbi:MAG: 50S ribosomal protein L7/L12 [Epsilonproteobacteria bacterium]|jgi:large subunit ribosomal protein L7/L12|nr:50S ribosomal protein L7/L12 [Campylobacterota bacterium]
MAISKEDVLEFISGLSVLELSELVKEFEEKFGVSAQPVAVAGGAVAAVEAVEEQTEFTVVLVDAGDKKINVIKEIRALTGLGLKEAKTMSEEANSIVKESVPKDVAEAAKAQLESAGAKVIIK